MEAIVKGKPRKGAVEKKTQLEGKIGKAYDAAGDALEHLSQTPNFARIDFTYVDRMLARIVDPPTDAKQKNGRRGISMIKQWMLEEGPGVILLEVLGQLCWRLVDLKGEEVDLFRRVLPWLPGYSALVKDPRSAAIVVERIHHVRESKSRACAGFIRDLEGNSSPASTPRSEQYRENTPLHHSPSSERASRSCSPIWDTNLSYDGLVKMFPATLKCRGLWKNDLERDLVDFYIHSFVPGRTFLQSNNSYLDIIRVAEKSEGARSALLSLSASYMKDYLSSDVTRYQEADHNYMVLAIQSLSKDLAFDEHTQSCLVTEMLLVHHGVVNELDSNVCWTCHIDMLDVLQRRNEFESSSEPALFMAYQFILAMTAQPIARIRARKPKQLDWIVDREAGDLQQICGILGLSRQLLYLVASTTNLATQEISSDERGERGEAIAVQLGNIHQWTEDATGEALDVALQTAMAYCLAARLYLLCRVFGATRSHPSVIETQEELYQLIILLPSDGPLFTAIHPTWSIFILATTCDVGRRQPLFRLLQAIEERNKGNISTLLPYLVKLWAWHDVHPPTVHWSKGWWEKMLDSVPHRSKILSLG